MAGQAEQTAHSRICVFQIKSLATGNLIAIVQEIPRREAPSLQPLHSAAVLQPHLNQTAVQSQPSVSGRRLCSFAGVIPVVYWQRSAIKRLGVGTVKAGALAASAIGPTSATRGSGTRSVKSGFLLSRRRAWPARRFACPHSAAGRSAASSSSPDGGAKYRRLPPCMTREPSGVRQLALAATPCSKSARAASGDGGFAARHLPAARPRVHQQDGVRRACCGFGVGQGRAVVALR